MYAKRELNKEQEILKSLSNAYKSYNIADWNYGKADMQVGTFLVDGCIESSEKLKFIATIIGKGLLEENSDAKIANLLFQRLYKEGFAGGLFKQEIQNNFKEILPPRSIERLNDGASMADCMKSICIYEQTFSMKQ